MMSVIWTGYGFAKPTIGIEKQLPEFYRAVEAILGPQRTQTFFRSWTEHEVTHFTRSVDFSLRTEGLNQPTVPSSGYLFHKKGSDIFGLLGELYGSALMRNRAMGELQFMNESAIIEVMTRRWARPDGILYNAQRKDQLVIHGLLESKMGTMNYNTNQVLQYIHGWRTYGMAVEGPNGRKQVYQPEQIRIWKDRRAIPIESVTISDIYDITLLVSHKLPPGISVEQVEPPFTPTEGRMIVMQYFAQLVEGRSIDPTRIRDTPHLVETSDQPHLDMLHDWIMTYGSWPDTQGGALSRYLAGKIKTLGGQSNVFAHCLRPEAREKLFQIGEMPARESMVRLLRRAKVIDDDILIVIRYYTDFYHRDVSIEDAILQVQKLNRVFSKLEKSMLPSRCGLNLNYEAAS
jgi:hypothetical protein